MKMTAEAQREGRGLFKAGAVSSEAGRGKAGEPEGQPGPGRGVGGGVARPADSTSAPGPVKGASFSSLLNGNSQGASSKDYVSRFTDSNQGILVEAGEGSDTRSHLRLTLRPSP